MNTTGLTIVHTPAAPSAMPGASPLSSAVQPSTAADLGGMAASEVRVHVQSSTDVVHARRHARTLGSLAGFSASDLTLIATAVSEIVRNIVEYAGDGDLTIALVRESGAVGVRMTARDSGPGIADVPLVMRDGYSSGGHLGIGLPGARRLMDDFHIESSPGRGTTVTMAKWLR